MRLNQESEKEQSVLKDLGWTTVGVVAKSLLIGIGAGVFALGRGTWNLMNTAAGGNLAALLGNTPTVGDVLPRFYAEVLPQVAWSSVICTAGQYLNVPPASMPVSPVVCADLSLINVWSQSATAAVDAGAVGLVFFGALGVKHMWSQHVWPKMHIPQMPTGESDQDRNDINS